MMEMVINDGNDGNDGINNGAVSEDKTATTMISAYCFLALIVVRRHHAVAIISTVRYWQRSIGCGSDICLVPRSKSIPNDILSLWRCLYVETCSHQ